MISDKRTRVAVTTSSAVIVALALVSLVLVYSRFPSGYASITAWWIIPVLAFVAEFLPVEVSQRGVRITFSIPFIAAMAAAVGPFGAVLLDLSISLAFGVGTQLRQEGRSGWKWVPVNMAIAVICASLASGAFRLALHADVGAFKGTFAGIVFTTIYGITNFLLVSSLASLESRRPFGGSVLSNLRIGAQAIALYSVISLAAVVFTMKELYVLLPLTFVPVTLLRSVLLLRTQMMEHYYETVSALTLMLQRAHPYTHGHLQRVAQISEEVALRLGIPAPRARLVREASVLHDIGKIAIDEEILDKPSKLDEAEMDHVRGHSALGAQILSPVASFSEMVPWIRHHHERPDGTGYPDGLQDVEIPLESKIIAVVDAFDAMTGGVEGSDKRPYREPMSVRDALGELERCAGSQFDKQVVHAFTEVILRGVA